MHRKWSAPAAVALLLGLDIAGCSVSPASECAGQAFQVGVGEALRSETFDVTVLQALPADGLPFDHPSEFPDLPNEHFLAVELSYTAFTNAAVADPAQWFLGWEGAAANPFAYTRLPSPQLGSRKRLHAGDTLNTWLVYEVPNMTAGRLWWVGRAMHQPDGKSICPFVNLGP
jgi:hypothetical protein